MNPSNALIINDHPRLTVFWKGFKKFWPIYCLVMPAVLWRFIYTIIPLVETFRLSLTNTSLVNPGRFID